MPELLSVYEGRVAPDWIDYNGHMRDGYYGVMFSSATDNLMDHIGVDAAYRARTRQTLYTLVMKLHFLSEIGAGAAFTVTAQLLAADAKKFHVFLRMRARADERLVCTCESIMLHVDQTAGPASAPFPEAVAARVRALLADHAALPWPETAGQPITLARKKPPA